MTEEKLVKIYKQQFEKLNKQRIREIKKLSSQNIFSILKMEDFEIRHSNFLAWLFDSDCNGDIGNCCLKMFLKELKNISDIFSNINLNMFFKNKNIVKREVKYKDILIESEEYKKVIVIENKIYSSEHSDQLNRYYNEVLQDEKYFNYDKYFVYLTLSGEMPEREEDRNIWVPFSYKQILEILQNLLNKKRGKISSSIQLLLQDYKEILEDKMEKSMNRIVEYRNLYDKYPDIALEFKSYIPDIEERLRIQREYINGQNGCIYKGGKNNECVWFENVELEELSKKNFQKPDAVYFDFLNRGRNTITFRIRVSDYDIERRKNFVQKFVNYFKLKEKSYKEDAKENIIAIKQIINVRDDSQLKEFDIQEMILNGLKSLFEDQNSIYFQIVDFVKKEYFSV